jgi:hypothetical protein
MNCGTCIAYLRKKNRCPGCRIPSDSKAVSIKRCSVTACAKLESTVSKFCYECSTFPCKRIKQLDKRYSAKYRTSFIENLMLIKENGIESFLRFEGERRTCPNCGSVLCVHKSFCLQCNWELQ